MATVMNPPDLAITDVLPLVLMMATDSVSIQYHSSFIPMIVKKNSILNRKFAFYVFFQVANLRFNVAKGLETIAPVCGSSVTDTQIRPILDLLVEDPDRDVRYYANKTLESLDRE